MLVYVGRFRVGFFDFGRSIFDFFFVFELHVDMHHNFVPQKWNGLIWSDGLLPKIHFHLWFRKIPTKSGPAGGRGIIVVRVLLG